MCPFLLDSVPNTIGLGRATARRSTPSAPHADALKGHLMIQKLGPARFVLPALVVILVGCVMSLMFYPMIAMSPKELPFAVLNLDEGATTPQGDVNAGEKMVQGLLESSADEGEDAPIAWEIVDSQDELDEVLADNEYYGALTIPVDFAQSQAAAQAGQGEASAVDVALDNAKSPLLATQLQSRMGAMFEQQGLAADVEVINTGDAQSTAASPMAGMMSQQIGIMPLMMMSLAASVLLTRILPRARAHSAGGRFATLGTQVGLAAVVSFVAALTTVCMLEWIVEANAPFWTTTLFLWVASLAVMLLFLGAFDIALPLGLLTVLFALLCGMMTGVLPAEALPAFWADWIHPWAPQAHIGDGLRDILYRGADLMPRGTGGLLALGGVGLALLVIAGLLPSRRVEEPVEAQATPVDGQTQLAGAHEPRH